jgi:hypothetical protein
MASPKGNEKSLKRRQVRDALINQVLGMVWKKYQPKGLVSADATGQLRAHRGPKFSTKVSSERFLFSVKYRF